MSDTAARYSIAPSDWKTYAFVQTMIDGLPDPIFAKDLQHRIVAGNQAVCTLIGHPFDQLMGKSDNDLFPPDQAAHFIAIDELVTTTEQTHAVEEKLTDAAGELHVLWTRKFPLRNTHGAIIGLCGVITDITAFKRRQEHVEQLEAAVQEKLMIIESQNLLLDELAVPVIKLWEGILLVPLIGVIDSRRAGRILESMLEAIGRFSAEIVIVDITGVPVVDTSVASYVVRAVQAANLLGCRSILVGIRSEIAQTLVGLGVDFSRILTRSTLQDGLEYGLQQLNYDVRRR